MQWFDKRGRGDVANATYDGRTWREWQRGPRRRRVREVERAFDRSLNGDVVTTRSDRLL